MKKKQKKKLCFHRTTPCVALFLYNNHFIFILMRDADAHSIWSYLNQWNIEYWIVWFNKKKRRKYQQINSVWSTFDINYFFIVSMDERNWMKKCCKKCVCVWCVSSGEFIDVRRCLLSSLEHWSSLVRLHFLLNFNFNRFEVFFEFLELVGVVELVELVERFFVEHVISCFAGTVSVWENDFVDLSIDFNCNFELNQALSLNLMEIIDIIKTDLTEWTLRCCAHYNPSNNDFSPNYSIVFIPCRFIHPLNKYSFVWFQWPSKRLIRINKCLIFLGRNKIEILNENADKMWQYVLAVWIRDLFLKKRAILLSLYFNIDRWFYWNSFVQYVFFCISHRLRFICWWSLIFFSLYFLSLLKQY